MKFNPRVAICLMAYGHVSNTDTENWIIQTTAKCAKDKTNLLHFVYDDTPTPMVRNRALKDCIDNEVDLAILVDGDLYPDAVMPENHFFDRALNFYIRHYYDAPTLYAAPYCGPPPDECVFIFRWRNHETDNPNPDFDLKMFTREEAAERTGVEAVAALPTGLMAVDMRVVTGFECKGTMVKLPPPWFDYEYKDEFETEKASTEDVFFARNVGLLFGQYGLETVWCDWDCWAGHWKKKLVGKPTKVDLGGMTKLFETGLRDEMAMHAFDILKKDYTRLADENMTMARRLTELGKRRDDLAKLVAGAIKETSHE